MSCLKSESESWYRSSTPYITLPHVGSLSVLKSIQTFPPCFILLSALYQSSSTCNSHSSRLQSTLTHLAVKHFKIMLPNYKNKYFFFYFILPFVKPLKQLAVEYDVLKGDGFSSATINELSSSAVHKMSMTRIRFSPF